MTPVWPIPVVAYLLGSIPFGYLIVKLGHGADVRASGSGNIGATNVSRVAGKGAGIATLVLDTGKGYLAVWLTLHWPHSNIRWVMAAALAAIVGHTFSCWLGFRGGKGVATGLGVFLAISWQAMAAAALLWIIVIAFWRYVSLGSIAAAAALPFLIYLFYAPGHAPPRAVSLGSVLIAVLIIGKHRENIARLIAGTESRLTRKN
ncbi:MAG: glycerol-3-phosphate 1-O-acyltransferase PlsY [Candidatus Acidiferrales bacterium]